MWLQRNVIQILRVYGRAAGQRTFSGEDNTITCRVPAPASILLIADIERFRRPISSEAVQAIRGALELAGIKFIDENGGGPGVRLRKRQRLKKPK